MQGFLVAGHKPDSLRDLRHLAQRCGFGFARRAVQVVECCPRDARVMHGSRFLDLQRGGGERHRAAVVVIVIADRCLREDRRLGRLSARHISSNRSFPILAPYSRSSRAMIMPAGANAASPSSRAAFAEPVGSGDDHAAQLHERLAADIDRAAAPDAAT